MARSALGGGHTSCRHPFTTRLSPACRPFIARLLPFRHPFTTILLPFSPHQIDTWL